MRFYRQGDSGEPVRDIQGRLSALGHRTPDPPGEFGPGTEEAVRGFQRARGLPPDGIVGPETWRELVEAGYRLGDRLLHLTRPMLRGDDVADLQRRLNSLGFEAGKVDGIFGPDTLSGLLEFQRNRGMAEDGTVGPAVLQELELMARATAKTGREAVREREWLRRAPSVVAHRIFLDASCRDEKEARACWEAAAGAARRLREAGAVPILSRSADVLLSERIRARRANRMGADLVVGFQLPANDVEAVFFFASPLSRSEVGETLAGMLAARFGLLSEGRSSIILKETRAPAVVVATENVGEMTGAEVADALEQLFARPQDPASWR